MMNQKIEWIEQAVSAPDQKILEHLKLNKGVLASFTDGKNIGKYGIITSIEEQTGRKRRDILVAIETNMNPTMGFFLGLKAFAAAVVGGIGSVRVLSLQNVALDGFAVSLNRSD